MIVQILLYDGSGLRCGLVTECLCRMLRVLYTDRHTKTQAHRHTYKNRQTDTHRQRERGG